MALPVMDTLSDDAPGSVRRARTPEEADHVRARLIWEGYPLADLTDKENRYYWVSLTRHVRWRQLQAFTEMTDGQLRARIKQIRQQYRDQTGKR